MKNKRILVFGSNSFSGSNFINTLLKSGYDAIGVSRSIEIESPFRPYNADNPNYKFFQFDLNKDYSNIVKLCFEYEIKTIVKLIKDSAQIKACELELNAVNKKLIESTALNTKLQYKITGRNSAIMWLIIALLCSIIINVILIKKW